MYLFLVTNDTGYGDEITGSGTHRHRDREEPPACPPPAVPNSTIPTNIIANHVPLIAHTQAIGITVL